MKVWVDADACPTAIKDILIRAANRVEIKVTFIANQWLRLPPSPFVNFIQVEDGPDIADDKIADDCASGDLVITADIPLAVRIVAKGALGLNPRGELYNKGNIGQISDMRDFMSTLRSDGVETGGPKSFSARDSQQFANTLDKLLVNHQK